MRKYKDLKFWQRSVNLATQVYSITSQFPAEERFGLISQMRRAAVSVSSNIAEGAGRTSDKEYKHFLDIAYGSLYELQTQLIISNNLDYVKSDICKAIEDEIIEIQKMIFTYAKRFK